MVEAISTDIEIFTELHRPEWATYAFALCCWPGVADVVMGQSNFAQPIQARLATGCYHGT